MYNGISVKTDKKLSSNLPVIDFGTRKIISQGFSRLLVIPKPSLTGFGLREPKLVNVKLIQENGERYIKLTPIPNNNIEEP